MISRLPPPRAEVSAFTALDAYLRRIGYDGPCAVDHATLVGIVRAHIAAIPFENVDVLLQRRVSSALPAIYDKLVVRRRGGWCFEQNGLLGWALTALGFPVMRIGGGVMRVERGDAAVGNHLALIVMLDRPWLVDVGFGGSLAEPIPFAEGRHDHAPFDIALKPIGEGWWRFEEWIGGMPFSWDFRPEPADDSRLAAHLVALQTDPASVFVQNLVAQRRIGSVHLALRGRVLTESTPWAREKRLLMSGAEIVEVLADRFGIDVPEVATMWPSIEARHRDLFG